jgi:hypothetical protein
MSDRPPIFTAGQIAALLRCDARVIRRDLEGVAPDHDGAGRRAWHFETLPAALRQRIEAESKRQGFAAPAKALAFDHARHGWQPALPLAECSKAAITEATKLRQALARTIALKDDATVSRAELVRMGMEDWRRVFRPKPERMISERRWFDLFHRTLDRAGSVWPLDAVEIYLPDRPARKTVVVEVAVALAAPLPDDSFADVQAAIDKIADPLKQQITASEKELVLEEACAWCEQRADDGTSQKLAREELFNFLVVQVPGLAPNRNALRVAFDRAWKRHLHGEDLRDRRAAANARRAKVLDMEEMERVIHLALRKYRNRLAPALREVRGGQPGARKSYVPQTVRTATAHRIAALAPFQQGPRAADKASPSMELSYDGIRPMDCLVIDDATWNVYLKWPLPEGGWKLTRGQIILIIDFRTLRVLHYGIIPEEQPNSLLAFTVTTRAIAEFGIPKAIYLERGKVFAESKLMTGGKRTVQAMRLPGWDDIPAADRELGLQRLGLKIITARRARSKAVELVIGLLQNRTDGEVGFCGRHERFDRPEALTRLLKEAGSRDIERSAKALAQFYTIEEWAERFQAHCDAYNAEPQEGKHLQGLSPEAAFQAWWPHDDPPTKLDAGCRHWLAHHRKPVDVRGGAISFVLRGEKFTYRHEALSPLEGRKVLAWLDPELPEVITVTDMKQANPLSIERCQQPNALAVLTDPDDPVLASETAKVQRHQRYWAGEHRTLKAKFEPTFRKNLVSRQVAALGEQMTRQREETIQRREDTEKREQRGRSRLNKLGLSAATVARNADVDSGSRELADLMAQARAEESTEESST